LQDAEDALRETQAAIAGREGIEIFSQRMAPLGVAGSVNIYVGFGYFRSPG
jgi:hypothetical protein